MACWPEKTTGIEAVSPLDVSSEGAHHGSGAAISMLVVSGLSTFLGLAFSLFTLSFKPILIGVAIAMALPILIVGILWLFSGTPNQLPRQLIAR